jgi:hypothetical protein
MLLFISRRNQIWLRFLSFQPFFRKRKIMSVAVASSSPPSSSEVAAQKPQKVTVFVRENNAVLYRFEEDCEGHRHPVRKKTTWYFLSEAARDKYNVDRNENWSNSEYDYSFVVSSSAFSPDGHSFSKDPGEVCFLTDVLEEKRELRLKLEKQFAAYLDREIAPWTVLDLFHT